MGYSHSVFSIIRKPIVLESYHEYHWQCSKHDSIFNANSLASMILLVYPSLRPLLLRSPAKLPLHLRHLQPNNPSHLKILLMIPEKALPMRHLLPNPRPRHPHILLAPDLPLSTTQSPNLFLIINRNKHLLYTGEIVCQVFLETARNEGARCVAASEEIVVAAGAIHHAVCGDVEDGAVYGEVDGEGGVGAIVKGKVRGV